MSEFPEIQGYKILKELGKGGMARVYLAFEEKLEREVALKILLKSLTEEKNLTARFLKEAKTAAGLRHTNIVPVFDVGREGEYYYFTMEHFEENLKDKIVNNKITPELALSIVKSIASALDYAHGKGFIHRDIKPDNIMFREDGTPVLVDFGIARALGSTTKLTKTGMSIGTPHYMSPEQARGKVLDGRSDIYSLGVVFYEMLTGKVPYEAEDSDSIAIAIKHIQEPIPDLWSEVRGQGLEVGEIKKYQNLINKMMAKKPEDRAQSGSEVMELISKETGDRRQELGGNLTEAISERDVGVQNIEPNLEKPKKFTKEKKASNIKLLVTSLIVLFGILGWYLIDSSNKRADASAYSSGYGSSRVTLRSGYRTISSYIDVKAMLKRRGFFATDDNPSGGFSNDFRVKTIRGDKVVIDRATGLMWHQSGSSSYMVFSKAEEWIRDLNRRGYAGHYDWRLPTLEEAASLLEQTERNGLYIDPFFSSKQKWIWTGDKYSSNRGWVVYFNDGSFIWSFFNLSLYVRPVRRDI